MKRSDWTLLAFIVTCAIAFAVAAVVIAVRY